jgi:hypothetical protein
MAHELLDFYNMDPDEDNQDGLRLAWMFKDEVDEATKAYVEMLQMTIDSSDQSPEDINQIVQQAINAALLTGIRAYRSWILTQGIDVTAVEANSGKDIPPDLFHSKARWPL